MDIKEQIKTIIVKNPPVPMNGNELCLFQSNSQYGQKTEQITTTTKPGLGVGIGVPVTKHLGIGIGKRKVKTKTTRELVWDKTKCVVLLTTDRFLYKIAKQVYQLDFDTFQDIQVHKDGITIVSNGRPYYFFMKNSDVKRFITIWSLIGEAAKQGLNNNDFI